MVFSKFENLPPELIVEISDYLDGCDLYYAFYGLNYRISTILDEQCHRLHVSFNNISKIKFDLCCQRILPRIASRIVSLTLYGDNSSTPGQLELFLSRFRFFGTIFIKIESLKLIDFTKMDVELLLPHLPNLIHLKYLSIGEYKRLMPFNINSNELFNTEVLLPKSICSLAFPYEISTEWIETSNTTKLFVERMHIHYIHMNSLFMFLQKFPQLKRLTTVLDHVDNNNLPMENLSQSIVTFDTLRYVNVNVTQRVLFDDFACFLKSVPQLDSLSVESLNPEYSFLEGNRWESVLPENLRLFRFDLTITSPILPIDVNHRQLLEGFKSKYWLSRCWFVECRLRDLGRYFRLSTIDSPIISILYWPDDEVLLESPNILTYPKVTHLELWWNLSKTTHSICPNVRSIQLYGAGSDENEPFDPNVCQILGCPSLEHIIINDNLSISQLRFASVLLKSSENIQILTCSSRWLNRILELKEYEWISLLITIRIRKLILIDDQDGSDHIDLISFCRTFINLKELTMKIESKQDLVFLLNLLEQLTMINITISNIDLDNIENITEWIEENTTLKNFIVRTQLITSNISKLMLWIGSRNISNNNISTLFKTFNY